MSRAYKALVRRFLRPYRLLLGLEHQPPEPDGRDLPWWLFLGMGAGVIVYAAVLVALGGGVLWWVLATAVLIHYEASVIGAALSSRRWQGRPPRRPPG